MTETTAPVLSSGIPMPMIHRRPDPPSDPPAPERPNDVSVTGPGGWGLRVAGRDTIIILLLSATLAWLVYSTRQEHQAIVEELSAVSYLMSIKPEDRPRLTPPRNLWNRLEKSQ